MCRSRRMRRRTSTSADGKSQSIAADGDLEMSGGSGGRSLAWNPAAEITRPPSASELIPAGYAVRLTGYRCLAGMVLARPGRAPRTLQRPCSPTAASRCTPHRFTFPRGLRCTRPAQGTLLPVLSWLTDRLALAGSVREEMRPIGGLRRVGAAKRAREPGSRSGPAFMPPLVYFRDLRPTFRGFLAL
jgi:hypothetical protein